MSPGHTTVRFTLNGRQYKLTRAAVEARPATVMPKAIRKHAVRVSETWFPVVQAFEVATGIPRSEYMHRGRDI